MIITLFNQKTPKKQPPEIPKRRAIFRHLPIFSSHRDVYSQVRKYMTFFISDVILIGDMFFYLFHHQNHIEFPANAPVLAESTSFFDKMDFKLARYLHHIRRAGKFLP
ncbi:hypothetical protein E0I74_30430 [Rhizobium laguerreae]|nr:hypothetical protein E0I74_30430 [Rhizobium laguerreae]